MASSSPTILLLLLLLQLVLPIAHAARVSFTPGGGGGGSSSRCPRFTSALAFGDSTTDTGNDIIQNPVVFNNSAHFPYGQTFFHRPTGRYSDGRLMVDYLMTALRQPLVQPYLSINPLPPNDTSSSSSASNASTPAPAPARLSPGGPPADQTYQNFAFSGATALDEATLVSIAGEQLRRAVFTTINLGEELRWFDDAVHKQHIRLPEAVVYFGEIGGNDYNYAIGSGDNASTVVPRLIKPVVRRLRHAINHVLEGGVRHLLVQGQFPQGCLSLYLTLFKGVAPDSAYDSQGCITAVNSISARHNQLLREVVDNATRAYPDAEILFLDTYGAYTHILADPAAYNITNTLDACDTRDALRFSGAEAPLLAGRAGDTCKNPENYLSWDSIHMTDATYGLMSQLFITDERFVSHYPNFLSRCASSS